MVKKLLALSISTALLSGCFQVNTSQKPIPTTYPVSDQQKMQAAHHWDVLASYEAKLIAKAFTSYQANLYIDKGRSQTSFHEGYEQLITSQLVQQGLSVKTTPEGAAQLSFDVSVITHKGQDSRRMAPGSWTMLAAGVAVASEAVDHWSRPVKLLLPLAVGADLYSGNFVNDSNTEVIITTRVVEGQRILYSSSNIYYINAKDTDHYEATKAPTRTVKITNTGGEQ